MQKMLTIRDEKCIIKLFYHIILNRYGTIKKLGSGMELIYESILGADVRIGKRSLDKKGVASPKKIRNDLSAMQKRL